MRIQHNIAALNSYRQLGSNNNSVSKNLEKLSSGFRINRAGDDAAGLAISEKMRAQITGLETAQKNAQDGISLVQTAEGALTEVHSMLNRMVELADQSANGTYDNAVDRANLQKELSSLKSEIDRISEGTNFNGINLLDGSLSSRSSAIAGFSGASTAATNGRNTSAAGFFDFSASDTINIDGTDVRIDWSQLSATDRTALSQNWTATAAPAPSVADAELAASVMQKAINASIDKHNQDNGSSLQNIKVTAGGGALAVKTFSFTSGLNEGSSKISFSTGTAGATNNSVLTGMFAATGATANVQSAAPASSLKINAADLNAAEFSMKIGDQDVSVTLGALTAASTTNDVLTALNTAIGTSLTNYDAAQGNTAGTSDGTVVARLGQNGAIEIVNTSGKEVTFEDKNGGSAAKTLGLSAEGKSSGGLDLQIGDTGASFNQLNVKVDSMSTDALGLTSVSIANQSSAKAAVDTIKKAIDSVSSTRGDLGAIQNRLEHTINNLSVTTENMTAAESRIRDTDMASEMMAYTKNNILVQASQAMLAQANQMPQGVLQLLQ